MGKIKCIGRLNWTRLPGLLNWIELGKGYVRPRRGQKRTEQVGIQGSKPRGEKRGALKRI